DTYPLSLHDALPLSSNSLRRVVTDFRRAMYSSSSVINPASDSIFKRFSVDRRVSISARLSLPGTNTCSRTRFGPSAVKKAASSRLSSFLALNRTPLHRPVSDVELDGVRVRGYIDQVLKADSDDSVRGRDVKTGAQPGDALQLKVYAVALEDTYGVQAPTGDYWMGKK